MIDGQPGRPAAADDRPPGARQVLYPAAARTEPASGPIRGTVRILPEALIELIELTVRDTPGITAFSTSRGAHHAFSRPFAADRDALLFRSGGIRVGVHMDRLWVDVAVIVERNANILRVSQSVRRRVGRVAAHMLGLTVTDVNVHVADINGSSTAEGL